MVAKEAIREAAKRSARSSAELEGRVVPEGFIRSPEVQRFLERCREHREQRDMLEDIDVI